MSTAGQIIYNWRDRQELSQVGLGILVDMSGSMISHIENGAKIPSDDEARVIARALRCDPDRLIAACRKDRQDKQYIAPPSPEGLFDPEYLQKAHDLVEECEKLRMSGHLNLAVDGTSLLLSRWFPYFVGNNLPSTPPFAKHIFARALITRTMALTMTLSRHVIRRSTHMLMLPEIEAYRQIFLPNQDMLFYDMALMLPAFTSYLMGKPSQVKEWNTKHFKDVKSSYIRALCLRDLLIIIDKKDDLFRYEMLIHQAEEMFAQGIIEAIDYARILEGKAQIVFNSENFFEAHTILTEAKAISPENIDIYRPSIKSQIARTEVSHLCRLPSLDEDMIIKTARAAIAFAEVRNFTRHVKQIKLALAQTNSTRIHDFLVTL